MLHWRVISLVFMVITRENFEIAFRDCNKRSYLNKCHNFNLTDVWMFICYHVCYQGLNAQLMSEFSDPHFDTLSRCFLGLGFHFLIFIEIQDSLLLNLSICIF